MEKGKYLLRACRWSYKILFYWNMNLCKIFTWLLLVWWLVSRGHVSILKISENHILSVGDFGDISLYEFNYENELFKKEQIHLSREDTENIEKIIDIERPEKIAEKEDNYGHGKLINKIKKFGETIIRRLAMKKKIVLLCVFGINNNNI